MIPKIVVNIYFFTTCMYYLLAFLTESTVNNYALPRLLETLIPYVIITTLVKGYLNFDVQKKQEASKTWSDFKILGTPYIITTVITTLIKFISQTPIMFALWYLVYHVDSEQTFAYGLALTVTIALLIWLTFNLLFDMAQAYITAEILTPFEAIQKSVKFVTKHPKDVLKMKMIFTGMSVINWLTAGLSNVRYLPMKIEKRHQLIKELAK